LSWKPSCRQVQASKNSSKVPMPPGRARKASARSAIMAFALVHGVDHVQLGAIALGPFASTIACGMMPTTRRRRQRRVGQHAHQAVVAAAVDQLAAVLADPGPTSRGLGEKRGSTPGREPQ
jgi:hypothetical protein